MLICNLNELDNPGSKGFLVDEQSYFIVQRDDVINVFLNHCPHLGVELEWQEDQFLDMDKHYIQCSTHGALFKPEDGECVSGPCIGEKLIPVAFEIRDGQVFLLQG